MAPNLILQPSEDSHFEATIQTPRALEEIRPLLAPADASRLSEIYGDQPARVWGAAPGEEDSNVQKWRRIQPQDVACFVRKGEVIYWGEVVHASRSEVLAEQLWGRDDAGQTWEYLYFLGDGSACAIDVNQVFRQLGYKESGFLRALTIVAKPKIDSLLMRVPDLRSLFLEEDADSAPPIRAEDRLLVRDYSTGVTDPGELEALLAKLEEGLAGKPAKRRRYMARAIARNRRIAELVKARADYRCQVCGELGFKKRRGGRYTEVHHIQELAQGGADLPSNMLCLCANCHREVHHGRRALVCPDSRWQLI